MNTPSEIPRIEGLFVAGGAGEPMVARTIVFAEEDRGLRGDRYSVGEGSFSKKLNKIRQVSLISTEGIMEANAMLIEPYTFEETRRNIITSGIDLEAILNSEQRMLRIGSTVLEIIDDCAPCKRPEKLSGKLGFSEAFVGHGGARARVIKSGLIVVGDLIEH